MIAAVHIPISRGLFAIVDAEDAERVRAHRWWAYKSSTATSWYARTRIGGKFVAMPNFIMGSPELFDHRDLDGLNNRRENLRPATRSQNQFNRPAQRGGSSRFKGVSFCKLTGRWRADISAHGHTRRLGRFDTEEQAAAAYNAAARELHGSFARLNVLAEVPA